MMTVVLSAGGRGMWPYGLSHDGGTVVLRTLQICLGLAEEAGSQAVCWFMGGKGNLVFAAGIVRVAWCSFLPSLWIWLVPGLLQVLCMTWACPRCLHHHQPWVKQALLLGWAPAPSPTPLASQSHGASSSALGPALCRRALRRFLGRRGFFFAAENTRHLYKQLC